MSRIAVVEDNPDNRLLVRAMLEDWFEIQEYGCGEDALEGFRQTPPDLVLLDISLPGISGAELLQAMRRDARLAAIPVIALTARAMAGDREAFLARGFDEYVSKPILDDDALLGSIRSLLQRARP